MIIIVKEDLIKLGFTLESLPSGNKTNLIHSHEFLINDCSPSLNRGRYCFTLYCNISEVPERIRTLRFV